MLAFLFFIFAGKTVLSQSQDAPIHPSLIGTGVFLGVTPPLRDLPALTPAEIEQMKIMALNKAARNKEKKLLRGKSFISKLAKMENIKEIYRCLCFNCNYCIGFWGVCEHKL